MPEDISGISRDLPCEKIMSVSKEGTHVFMSIAPAIPL
jgi:hypothetical protein